MKLVWIFIIVACCVLLYVNLTYSSADVTEGFRPRCPNVLVQQGNEIWLKNTNLADIPGVNPVVFHNLDEYTEFVQWQKSQGIDCPLLYLQKTYDPQNTPIYKPHPVKKLTDATRDDPPYNTNSYPGMDPQNQGIGDVSDLDVYGDVGQTQETSKNAMDPNWQKVNS
jgi:hypothetical protein